jgi:hypothetical protein
VTQAKGSEFNPWYPPKVNKQINVIFFILDHLDSVCYQYLLAMWLWVVLLRGGSLHFHDDILGSLETWSLSHYPDLTFNDKKKRMNMKQDPFTIGCRKVGFKWWRLGETLCAAEGVKMEGRRWRGPSLVDTLGALKSASIQWEHHLPHLDMRTKRSRARTLLRRKYCLCGRGYYL